MHIAIVILSTNFTTRNSDLCQSCTRHGNRIAIVVQYKLGIAFIIQNRVSIAVFQNFILTHR